MDPDGATTTTTPTTTLVEAASNSSGGGTAGIYIAVAILAVALVAILATLTWVMLKHRRRT